MISTILKITFFVVFLVLFTYVIVISIITPILWQKYNQALVDATLNSGVVTVDWTIVHPGYSGSPPIVTMESNVTFTSTGPMAATLKSATFDVHWLGIYLGNMTTPSNYFQGNQQPLTVHQFTNMTIANVTAYNQQASIVANGGTIYWRFSGNVELSLKQYGLTFDFTVYMIKDIQVVGKSPINVKTFGIQPLKGEKTVLYSTANQSFINPSNIGAQGLGNVTMAIYDSNEVYIGNAIIPELDLKIGPNLQTGIVSSAILTEESQSAIETMFGNWAMGIDQPFLAKGPINTTSGFYPLYNTSYQHFTVVGNKIPLIQDATIGLGGIFPTQTIVNPTNMDVNNSNMIFTANVPPMSNGFYVSFTNVSPLIAPLTNVTCPSSNDGIALTYAGLGGSFILPASGSYYTTFGPTGKIQPCGDFIPLAICCGLAQGVFTGIPNTTNTFLVNLAGHVTIGIEEFFFRQYYAQQGLLTTCAPITFCDLMFSNICQVPALGMTCN